MTTTTQRDDLKTKFADNARPTGADFAQWIDQGVIQGDDGLTTTGAEATLDKPLNIDAARRQALTVTGQTQLNDTLTVTGDTEVQGELTVTGAAGLQDTLTVSQATTLQDTLHVTGNTELSGTLTVTGDTTQTGTQTNTGGIHTQGNLTADQATHLNGPVSVGQTAAEADSGHNALMHLAHRSNTNQDILKITPHADDTTPLVVDNASNLGLGHAEPINRLDVKGSQYIGVDAQKVEPLHSLGVQERLGIGTPAPQGRLDIRSNINELALSVRQNEDTLLSVQTGLDNTESTLGFDGNTNLKGTLNVGQETTLEQTLSVAGATHLDSQLTVQKETTLAKDLTVTGSATLRDTLKVKGNTTLAQDATIKGHTQLEETLAVTGATQLDAQLTVQGDARYAQTVGIGTDHGHQASASLHIKEATTRSALRVEHTNGKDSLSLTGADLRIGATDHAVNLTQTGDAHIKGKTHLEDQLQIDGPTTLAGQATAQTGLTIQQDPQQTGHTALKVEASGATNQAMHVRHQAHSLIVATTDKVGIQHETPEVGLHIGSDTQIDQNATIRGDLTVQTAEDQAPGLQVQTGRVAIGKALPTPMVNMPATTSPAMPTLDVQGDTHINGSVQLSGDQTVGGNQQLTGDSTINGQAHIQGDTTVAGNLKINHWVEIQPENMTLTTQKAEPVLHLNHTDQTEQTTRLAAGKIGINVTQPGQALEVVGDTQLTGRLKVTDTLTAEATGPITAHQPTTHEQAVTIQDHLDVHDGLHINQPSAAEQPVDLHLRQSSADSIALRIEQPRHNQPSLIVRSDRVGINTDQPEQPLHVIGSTQLDDQLHVGGSTTLDDDLTVTGATQLSNTLKVKDQVTADSNVTIAANLSLTTHTPDARIHIDNIQGPQPTSLRIDETAAAPTLLVRQGRTGLGTADPQTTLDVAGDAQIQHNLQVAQDTHIDQNLTVTEHTKLLSTLTVAQGTHLDGDLTVHSDVHISEKLRVTEQVILGTNQHEAKDEASVNPSAQLYIHNTRYKEALHIVGTDNNTGLIYRDGKLGIGKDQPSESLDVAGNSHITGHLEVGDHAEIAGKLKVEDNASFREDVTIHEDLRVKDNAEIEETLTVGREAHLKGDLTVDKDTTLNKGLNVAGKTELAHNLYVEGKTELASNLQVQQDTRLKGTLTLSGTANLAQDLNITGRIQAGTQTDTVRAHYHLQSPGDDATPFILDKKGRDPGQPLLQVNANGHIGVGTATPQATLDVCGNLHTTQLNTSCAQADKTQTRHLQIGTSQTVLGIDADPHLGADQGRDDLLATQAAIKAYIHEVASPFGNSRRTIAIRAQYQFDEQFNNPADATIPADTTIILLPLDSQDDKVGAYRLQRSVRLESGVSIIGFNPQTTIIQKQTPEARFELVGRSDNPVRQVTLDGFTYDGCNQISNQNGAAFYLQHAEHCKLNCHIKNHVTALNGGALYAEQEGSHYTASQIEAKHIHHCNAHRSGGGAHGVSESIIHAHHCTAYQGGAVAYCATSQVEAYHCSASSDGGAASHADLLQLLARHCQAQNGGGGAYYCKDLICTGQWYGNNATIGPNVYTNDDRSDADHKQYYWKADYLGQRLTQGAGKWNNYNA